MLKRWLAALAVVLAAAGLASSFAASAEVALPALTTRVTDLTGTLTAEQKNTLEQRLAAFEARKGSQVAVLMLPTTKPEEIEQFSIRLAQAWKIGRKGTDDGVILVIAKDDRRLRIEVGYGLEGVIPDAIAKRVISDTITPKFKTGDFYGGVSDGVDRIIKLIDGEKLPPPSASSGLPQGERDPSDWLGPAFIFLLIGGAVLRSMLGRFPGAIAMAVLAAIAGALLFNVLIAVIAAIAGFIFTLVNVGSLGRMGSGGFSSGGSSSGGGSFGGGGGSFGGGGSSGSW